MKKTLLIILTILLLCSCGKKKKEEVKENPNEITMSGIKYVVNEDAEAYNLKLKVASNFERRNFINCVSFYSEKINDEYNFIIRIFNFDKKANYDYIVEDITGKKLSYEDVVVNDVEYKFAVYEIEEDKIEIFMKKVGNEYYAISFLAKDDVKKLENVFLKEIIYNE